MKDSFNRANKKLEYQSPQLEIIKFSTQNKLITTSFEPDNLGEWAWELD